MYVRIVDGEINKGDRIRFMANNKTYDVTELGVMKPTRVPQTKLVSGEVGYIAASIKEMGYFVGDTITTVEKGAPSALPGYKKAIPMVFCGMYPVDNDDYGDLKESLEKLKLNDASITFEPESSEALGHGFRCGFLGLLHMEIIQERLEREYDISLITTAPSVVYKVHTTKGEVIEVDNPAYLPEPQHREFIEEPYASPLRSGDLSGLPPAQVITAEFDPLRDEGEAYAKALNEAGVETYYECIPSLPHAFLVFFEMVPAAREAMQAACTRLAASL